jgi:hypothetical protein
VSLADDGFESAPAATCSRAGCRAPARWRVDWRNPRIHAEGRVKTWVACDEHVGYLQDFLEARDFPVSVGPLTSPATEAVT